MNVGLFLVIICLIYIINIFVFIWASGKFAGVRPFQFTMIVSIAIAVILNSVLCFSALYHVPFIVKPVILIFFGILTVYIFIVFLDIHVLRASAAGAFYVLCQFLLFIFLIRKFWYEDLFQIVKFIIFHNY
jgi:hypothetical protein